MGIAVNVVRAKTGQLVIDADLRAIEAAVGQSASPDDPIVVYGEAINEEVYAFVRRKEISTPVGPMKYINPAASIKRLYKGRTPLHEKISSFLVSYVFPTPPGTTSSHPHFITTESINAIKHLSFSELRSAIVSSYFKSRRIKVGSVEEIDDFLSILVEHYTGGVFVIRRSHYNGISLDTAINIWLWHNSPFNSYLVIAVNQDRKPNLVDFEFQRLYIESADLVQKAADTLGVDEGRLTNSLPILKAYLQGGSRELASRGFLTESAAMQILRAFDNLESSLPVNDVAEALPAQKLAPLSFEFLGTEIALAHEPANDIPSKQVVGAARALRGLLSDVLAIGGLENAIPQYRAKLFRISSILDRMIANESADESDIIELGVEISAVETRLHEAQDRLGELTTGEVLAFVLSARGFLNKFSDWEDYQRKGTSNGSVEDIKNAVTAVDILRAFASLGSGLTPEAKDRLNSFIDEDVQDFENPLKREGYSLSVENLAAEAAKPILEQLSNEAKALADETKKQVRSSIASSASTIFMKHAPQLYQFAANRGGHWIEMLMNLLKDRGG